MKKFVAVAVLFTGLAVAPGQDKTIKEDKKKADEPAVVIVKARLPAHFSKLGLSDKQKTAVYKVRADYAARIDKLTKEIAALRLRERDDAEAVLTESQRSRLKELRAGTESKK